MSAQQDAFLCCDDSVACADGGLQDCEQPSRCVYFCIRLSEAVVKTSAVLDGLCSAPGVATLPAMISEEEFLLWSKSDPSSPPADTKDLAKVLRVADALSDKRLPVWVQAMADRAASARWRGTGEFLQADAMHAALLSLSPNVRTSVLRSFVDSHTHALGLLPQTLHPYAVAAMIGSDGVLRCPDHETQHVSFLSQLRSLPGCGHPPLQSLNLMPMEASPSVCHVIVDALPSNPRLSSLHLKLHHTLQVQTSAMNVLFPSLAAATSLREIRLCHSKNYTYTPVAALAPLVRALPALPFLERLHVDDIACCMPESLGYFKPPDDAPTLAEADVLWGRWRRLLAAAASHPGLTRLSLTCVLAFEPLPWPDAFPRLQELILQISMDCPDIDRIQAAVGRSRRAQTRHACFPALSRLEFTLASAQGAAASSLKSLWPPIGTDSLCPAMRSIDLIVQGLTEEGVTPVWTAFAGALDSCPGLEELSVFSSHHDIMATIVCPRLPSSSIRSLCLNGYSHAAISPEQASNTAAAVRGLGSLRSLSLEATADPTCCYALRAVQHLPVGSLPGLTRLCFRMHWQTAAAMRCVSTAGVLEVLQTRTALRCVQAGEWVLSPAMAQQLWDALESMPHLQELALHSTEVADAGVRTLAAALPRMTSLTFLDMRPAQCPLHGGTGLVELLASCMHVVELLATELGRLRAAQPRPLQFVYSGLGDGASREVAQALAGMNIHCVDTIAGNGYNPYAYES